MNADQKTVPFKKYIINNPGKATVIIFSIAMGIIGLGALILPDIFWDKFIWRYFWGPIAADAQDRTVEGITEGYNTISTLTYGLILAAAILVIYRIIVVLDISLDKWFFLAVIPFIFFGGFARALEDAMLFNTPVVYIFISPLIYIVTGLVTVGLMVLSHILTRKKDHGNDKKKIVTNKSSNGIDPYLLGGVIAAIVTINAVLSLVFLQTSWTNYKINIFIPLLISIVLFIAILVYFRRLDDNRVPMALVLGSFGIIMFSYPAAAVAAWYTEPLAWTQVFLASKADGIFLTRPAVIPQVIALSLLATALWAAVAYAIARKTKLKNAVYFFSGVNLALVFGQFTDASATFIAIDYYSYWEKHVVPGLLIDVFGTAAVMFLLKVVALLFAVYVLDITLKSELGRHKQIVPLIKVAVLVLGMAPGLRDMLRLGMGV